MSFGTASRVSFVVCHIYIDINRLRSLCLCISVFSCLIQTSYLEEENQNNQNNNSNYQSNLEYAPQSGLCPAKGACGSECICQTTHVLSSIGMKMNCNTEA